MKNLIFLCIASAVVILTILDLNMGPVIKEDVSVNSWYDESCQKYVNLHKYNKDKSVTELSSLNVGVSTEDDKEDWLNLLNEGKNICYRKKAMIGLEYASFNFNIVFGFTCSLLGLLNYVNAANNLKKIIGLIGLASGAIGFVLNLVYIIYSELIFNNLVINKTFESLSTAYNNAIIKIKSDGSYAKWDDSKNKYLCIFYDKDNKDKFYLKYSDYGNKHLNYKTGDTYAEEEKNYEYMTTHGCASNSLPSWIDCKNLDESSVTYSKQPYYDSSSNQNNKVGDCEKLYYFDTYANNNKKNIYDRWVTSIIFSYFIIVLNVGLAIFGFLLFKDSNSNGPTPI